jgi:hypothetical protein
MSSEMTRGEEERRRYREQTAVFGKLSERVESLLERFGRPDYLPGQPHGDFQVHGDYSGYPQVVVFVDNLEMLRPNIIIELQNLVKEYSGWQIEMTVALRGHDDDWPNMGLYIRPHEIIDALQRQYFPKEFRNLEYEGARRGTPYD